MEYEIKLGWENLDFIERYCRFRKLRDWCNTNVGTDNWRYVGNYTKAPVIMYFRKEEDLLLFKLSCNF